MNHEPLPAQGPVDVTVGRHCWNEFCGGPEWWGLFDETPDKYRECPCCGYPCTMEKIPESAMTLEALCAAGWVTPNELNSQADRSAA